MLTPKQLKAPLDAKQANERKSTLIGRVGAAAAAAVNSLYANINSIMGSSTPENTGLVDTPRPVRSVRRTGVSAMAAAGAGAGKIRGEHANAAATRRPASAAARMPAAAQASAVARRPLSGQSPAAAAAAVTATPNRYLSAAGAGAIPPVVLTRPFKGVTAETGIEALGEALDVDADGRVGPSVEYIEAHHQLKHIPRAEKNYQPYFAPFPNYLRPPSCIRDWYAGWKVDFTLEPRYELPILRKYLAMPEGSVPHNFQDAQLIMQKMYKSYQTVFQCAQFFYCSLQIAYDDIKQLRNKAFLVENALHEANIKGKKLAEKIILATKAAEENQNKELSDLRRERDMVVSTVREILESIICPICTKVALLPKVLGPCGHIACQSCFKQLDDVVFATLNSLGRVGGSNPPRISTRQLLVDKRCHLCRTSAYAHGFPVHPLKKIIALLIANGLQPCDVPAYQSADSAQRVKEFATLTYEKLTPSEYYTHNLEINCHGQSLLAQDTVDKVIAKVTQEQWLAGVYILFEKAISPIFFETFSTTLQGKAGGVDVLVNSAQCFLAVQLKKAGQVVKQQDTHLMIKVGIGGSFTFSQTPQEQSKQSEQAFAPAAAAASAAAVPPATAMSDDKPAEQSKQSEQASTPAAAAASAAAVPPTTAMSDDKSTERPDTINASPAVPSASPSMIVVDSHLYTPMSYTSPLPPVVINMPHRETTAATGIEMLGRELDIFVEDSQPEHAPNNASVKPPKENCEQSQISIAYNKLSISELATEMWPPAWSLQHKYIIRDVKTAQHETAPTFPLLNFSNTNIFAFFKDLYYATQAASQYAELAQERLKQQNIDEILSPLRQRIINAVQALHEANLRCESLTEHFQDLAMPKTIERLKKENEQKQKEEINRLRRERDAWAPLFKQMREELICIICGDVMLLPKVLSQCGHTMCSACLSNFQKNAIDSLQAEPRSRNSGVSAWEMIIAQRCPACRAEILGDGFPVLALQTIAASLVLNKFINPCHESVPSVESEKRVKEFRTLQFTKQNAETRGDIAGRMVSYAFCKFAEFAVDEILKVISLKEWIDGVFVQCEKSAPRVFFEACGNIFFNKLKSKAEGAIVTPDERQCMFAIKVRDGNKPVIQPRTHRYIKLKSDGQFTVEIMSELFINVTNGQLRVRRTSELPPLALPSFVENPNTVNAAAGAGAGNQNQGSENNSANSSARPAP